MNPLFRTINFTLATILRSPLHSLLSRNLMLISVTGRQSQRTYTVPVSYQQHDREVRIISERHDRWWRNVRGGAPVTLQLQGHKITGQAQVIEAAPEVLSQLSEQLRQSTTIAKMLNVKRDEHGQFKSEDLNRAAERSVVVRIDLAQ
jgi:hypothetical protein